MRPRRPDAAAQPAGGPAADERSGGVPPGPVDAGGRPDDVLGGARAAPSDREPGTPDPSGIRARALSIGIAVGAYAISFGAVSVASGLDVWQAQALSALMFTGASQFAFVGVVAAGGGLVAAVLTAWLLGLRNGLYGLHLAGVLIPRRGVGTRLRGWRRWGAAHFTIDESTAMAMSYEGQRTPA